MAGLSFNRIAALGLGLSAIFLFAGFAGHAIAGDMRLPMQLAQASPDSAGATTGTAPELQGIGLTVSHKRIIYDNVAGEQTQGAAGEQKPVLGATIPDSVILNEIPIEVKDQVGLLRDFKFARLGSDNIAIVDPVSRKVVDIITREDGGR